MSLIKRSIIVILMIFLIAFPKGGFKINEIPVTWGYFILCLLTPLGLFSIITQKFLAYIPIERRIALIMCLPFIVYSASKLCLTSVGNFGFLISYILSIILMPLLFLLVFNKIIDEPNFSQLFNKTLIYIIRFVSFYGLILFLQKLATGSSLEIPYLTVNIADYGQMEEKYNAREFISKLTSTYNNGNIYGICMLILGPLYLENEKNKIFKVAFFTSLALTLSRTVWFGMIIYLLLFVGRKMKTIKGWLILLLTILLTIFATSILLHIMQTDVSFVFDKNIGGRSEQLNIFNDLPFIGDRRFDGILEIVYASILRNFGLIGLILFFPYIFSALITSIWFRKDMNINSHAHWGLIIYPLVCLSDGAMLFIPTMAFFWFLSSYVLIRTPQ